MSIWERISGAFFGFNFLELELSGDVPEELEKSLIPFAGARRKLTQWEVEKVLTYAETQPGIQGVIVKLSDLRIGLGRANGIRKCLEALREKGKRVVVYLESGGNVEYLIASSADYIYMPPWGMLNLIGLKAELTFYAEALSKIGVRAQMKGLGEYKSAAETFTRESMSGPHREMMNSLMGDLEEQLEVAVSEGRGLRAGEVKRLIDEGPFSAERALEHGLVNGVIYDTEIQDLIERNSAVKVKALKASKVLGLINYKDSLDSIYGWIARRRNIVAVVSISGIITSGRSRKGGTVKTIGSDSFIEILKRIEGDRRVAALVLRVLTPGGSGVASDIMRHRLKSLSGKMPVVVSMSDVAASGGYLIALGADTVLTDPMTLTGSIGIVSGKFDLSGLYDKIGVGKDSVSKGKHSLIFSTSRGFTKEEDEKIGEIMESYYGKFVNAVSDERSMDMKSAERAAKGRVWTGRQAKELGLVDELGGLADAYKITLRDAGISDSLARVKFISERRGIQISDFVRADSLSYALDLLFESLSSLTKERVLAIMPFDIDIK
jgi:protease-4